MIATSCKGASCCNRAESAGEPSLNKTHAAGGPCRASTRQTRACAGVRWRECRRAIHACSARYTQHTAQHACAQCARCSTRTPGACQQSPAPRCHAAATQSSKPRTRLQRQKSRAEQLQLVFLGGAYSRIVEFELHAGQQDGLARMTCSCAEAAPTRAHAQAHTDHAPAVTGTCPAQGAVRSEHGQACDQKHQRRAQLAGAQARTRCQLLRI